MVGVPFAGASDQPTEGRRHRRAVERPAGDVHRGAAVANQLHQRSADHRGELESVGRAERHGGTGMARNVIDHELPVGRQGVDAGLGFEERTAAATCSQFS